MAKIRCKCGYLFQINTEEEDFIFEVIAAKNIAAIINKWCEISNCDQFIDLIEKGQVDLYKCPICHRVLLEDSEHRGRFNLYYPEEW